MKIILATNSRAKGFTLVEMAIVLVVVGLLVSAFIAPLSAQRNLRDYSEVKTDLEQVREALYGYAIINGRLPCPTTQADPVAVGYGEAAATCAAPTSEGYLPWKTLGVREIDNWGTRRTVAADPWNGYLRYRVNPNAAVAFTLGTPFTPALSVLDSAGNALTSNTEPPLAIVFSAGKNLKPDGQNAGLFDRVYESDVPTAAFDDVTVWISRPVIMNRMVAAEKLPS